MGNPKDLDPEEVKKAAKIMAEEKKRLLKELKRAVAKYKMRYDSADYMYKDFGKERSGWAWSVCEWWGNADYPKPSVGKKAKASITALEAAVKGEKWKSLKSAFQAAERDVNAYYVAVNTYYNNFQSGASGTITVLSWTKTAGFISVGVLATTFVGGPVAVMVGLEGIKGAATAAAVGGMLKVQVDTVSTTIGRELAGEDVNYKKVLLKDIKDTVGAAIIGAIFQGPPAKLINDKLAKTVVKDFINDKQTLAIVSRLGVATTRTLLIKWFSSDGKGKVKAAVPKVAKGLKGNEKQEEVLARIIGETVKSKEFKKFLEQNEAKAK
jgi:hypothetical protein